MWVTGGVPVTHLRKMMLEELQRLNYSQNTTRCYIRTVEDFARRFNCSPDRLGLRHIREYQAELFQKGKLSANSVGQRLAALRFLYIKTLKRAWSISDTPYPKRTRHLPVILSKQEVARLIAAACTPLHRILLMTLYATGVRNAELTHLKFSTWLFPSDYRRDRPIDMKTVWHACHQAAKRASIQKRVYPHLLRHCFATHLFDAGTDLRTLQLLLGHKDLKETILYLQLSERRLNATASPLDSLPLNDEPPGEK